MEKYIDELKKKVLELCDTIAEQEDEIALNERVLNIVLEDHFCHSPNETVQSFIEAMRKRAAASRKKDIEEKREGKLYERMFYRLLWEYAHNPDCYYCPCQHCQRQRTGLKPESEACMDYIESEIRKICEERMIRDESKD